jgi:putative ABC transport system permease protein
MLSLNPRWRKMLRDLWINRTRTLLATLSISAGVFAVGMIAGMQDILTREVSAGYLAVNPSSAIIYTDTLFDDDLVSIVRRMPEVSEAQGRYSIVGRLQTGPDEWQALRLYALSSFDDIPIDCIRPEQGVWPPSELELLIERDALGSIQADIGDAVWIETPNGKRRDLRLVGTAHDVNVLPSRLAGVAYGYISLDTLERLGEPHQYNQLHILVAENRFDKPHIQQVVNLVQDKLEQNNERVNSVWMPPTPGQHIASDIIQAMVVVLGALGLLAVFLSGFLVVNTVSALLKQQVRQIGVMKTFGATVAQIATVYLNMALVFGVFALALGMPLGILSARELSKFLVGFINMDIKSSSISPHVLGLQIAIGLLVPLLAAFFPVVASVRITIRQAISSYGLTESQFKGTFFDHLLRRAARFPRPILLSLRSSFRRRGRLILTLASLTLGCAVFIAVFSVHASTRLTLEEASQYWQYDIEVTLRDLYRVERLIRQTIIIPGVTGVESWGTRAVRRVRPNGNESSNLFMVAPPADTDLLHPVVIEGRWLLADDKDSIVIDTQVLKTEPDIKVGDKLVLKIEDRETTWHVVGLIKGQLRGPTLYVNYSYFAKQAVREIGQSNRIVVVTNRHDAVSQSEALEALERHFKQIHLNIISSSTTSEMLSRIEIQFNIILIFLAIMAAVIGIVGSIGLMGTMSINVLERTREIGVMRAIGASDGAVLQIVIVEGVLIGLFSWFAGTMIALPLSKLLSDAVGLAFMQTPLNHTFSISGVLFCLVAIIVLSTLASFLPACKASRVSVRDALAYEG